MASNVNYEGSSVSTTSANEAPVFSSSEESREGTTSPVQSDLEEADIEFRNQQAWFHEVRPDFILFLDSITPPPPKHQLELAAFKFGRYQRSTDITATLRLFASWKFKNFTFQGISNYSAWGKAFAADTAPKTTSENRVISISSEDELATKDTCSRRVVNKRPVKTVSVMPKTLQTYYHTVIYFENVPKNYDVFYQIAELKYLESTLVSYAKTNRIDHRKHYIVCTHYFGSDFDAVRYLSPAIKCSLDTSSTNRYTKPVYTIKPHIHVVSYEKSRDGATGINNIIKQWAAKRRRSGLEFRQSARKVDCLHCISHYLYQGNGRILAAERISTPDEAIRCSNRAEGEEPDWAHYPFCFVPDDDEIWQMEGKLVRFYIV